VDVVEVVCGDGGRRVKGDKMELDLLKGAKGHHMYMYNMQKHPCAI
jgi:hypothetical protein